MINKIKAKINSLRQKKWDFRKIFATIVITLITLGIAGVIIFFAAIAIFSIGLPDVTKDLAPTLSTEILDRNGVPLYTIFGEQNRKYVEYNKISPYLINATIGIEDENFWAHKGFDMNGIARAVFYEVTGLGSRGGGSTITQQYVKNFFLTSQRSYIRKIKELILSVRLEQHYPKQKILELYLNQIPYGNNAYGVKKAAEIYFGKEPVDLNLGESIILASLPQLPSYYNPYGSHKYSTLAKTFTATEIARRNIKTEADLNSNEYNRGLIGKDVKLDETHSVYIKGRSDVVLNKMLELKYITLAEKNEAWNQIQTTNFLSLRNSMKAPLFVLYVQELLENKYGKDVMEQGGLKVYTTLDWKVQEATEKFIDLKAKDNEALGVSNSAVVSTDPKTGQILVMIGSRDYFNDDIDGKVNVTVKPRQPGSSFKPFVYANAFLNRYSPATVIYDTPLKLGPDTPSNWDGKWMGPLSVRKALGQSRNIPAIKAYYLGGEQKPIIDLATKMGITTLDQNHDYGYPLAIGAGEVKPIDMATAFGVFANTGMKQDLYPILKIENAKGEILEEWKAKDLQPALDPQVAYQINSILSDRSVNLGQYLNVEGHTMAAKTGTSTNKSKSKGTAYPMDLWAVGYTPSIVTIVWSGNSDGSPTKFGADGYNVSAPIMKTLMTEFLKDKPDEAFPIPEGIKHASVSTLSGLLPSDKTPPDKIKDEIFASFNVPTEIDNAFYELEINSKTNKIASEFTPKNLIVKKAFQKYQDPVPNQAWQNGIQEWVAMMKKTNPDMPDFPPTETDTEYTADTAARAPRITILSPAAYSTIGSDRINLQINYEAPLGFDKIEYYFDSRLRFSDSSGSTIADIKVPKYVIPGEKYLISAKIYDKLGYATEAIIEIRMAGNTIPQPIMMNPINPEPLFANPVTP